VAHALESIWQLVSPSGLLPCALISLSDAPEHPHRGLMIDAGRRFYPVALVESLLEGMAQFKMSVLHFHLSEECFRVQSIRFPELGRPCLDGHGHNNSQVYSRDEIAHLVGFAKMRGIRVVPEFELPGHASGLCSALAGHGLVCCGDWQIRDDPAGSSVRVLSELLDEMSALFPDKVLHIGGDETQSTAPCDSADVKSLEAKVIAHVISLGKQPMGWEDMLTGRYAYTVPGHADGWKGAAAAFPGTFISDSWWQPSWVESAFAGFPTVVSNSAPGAAGGSLYLNFALPVGSVWLDITEGSTNTTALANLLGAEVSQWSDNEMGCLFDSKNDANFSKTVLTSIFPRAAIAAGSFWRWNSSLVVGSTEFEALVAATQQRLARRGILSCACIDEQHNGCVGGSTPMICGVSSCSSVPSPPPPAPPAPPTPPPSPTPPGPAKNENKTYGITCNADDPHQRFMLVGGQLRNTGGLCVDTSGPKSSLNLSPCKAGDQNQQWTHDAATGALQSSSGGGCLDLGCGGTPVCGPLVGLYRCDSLFNQNWTVSGHTVAVVSEDKCLSDANAENVDRRTTGEADSQSIQQTLEGARLRNRVEDLRQLGSDGLITTEEGAEARRLALGLALKTDDDNELDDDKSLRDDLPALTLVDASTPKLTNVTTLFRHGVDGFACVRSPSLLLAGKRLIAFVERWNYTGNHCYPKGIPPVANFTVEQAAFQDYAFRSSDDGGRSWSRARSLPLRLLAWNLQTVYHDGVILMHVKEKNSGHIFQISSPDLVSHSAHTQRERGVRTSA
jgi:hexosaminidase